MPNRMNDERHSSDLMSTRMVGERLGLTKQAIYGLHSRGELRGQVVDGSGALVFRRADVERVARARAAALRRRAEALDAERVPA